MNRFINNTFRKPAVQWSLGGCILAIAVFILLYYITGPSIGYIHSDCTDSLLWALASEQTGAVLAEDFHYAALLPFGSPIWTVPILSVFGFSVTAYKLSMSVFAVLFALSAFSLFRAMRFKPISSSLSTFGLCLLLSGSPKLREIMWEHTIYYSIGILLTMLLLNLCLRLFPYLKAWELRRGDRKNYVWFIIFATLLLLLCIGCGLNGMQILIITVVPVLGAFMVQTLSDNHTRLFSRKATKHYIICGILLVGTVIGLLLLRVFTKGGAIIAGYEEAYSTWSSPSTWAQNAEIILGQYLSLFGIPQDIQQPLFSLESICIILQLGGALLTLICPILLAFRYHSLQHTSSKTIMWTHFLVSAVILFGMICGALSSAEWRLTPMLGTALLATIVYIREMFAGTIVCKRIAALIAAVLVSVSVLHSITILKMPYEYGKDREHAVIAQMLEEKGYDYGYATFWNCHITRLLSDDAVTVLPIEIINEDLHIYRHQLRDAWLQERNDEDCFLLLDRLEYAGLRDSQYWEEVLAPLPLIDTIEHGNFIVLVFQGNVIKE